MEDTGAHRRRGRRRLQMQGPGRDGGADFLSALPEDLILQILVRLHSIVTAARTSILSRRWRSLWTRLSDLIFREVQIRSIQAAVSLLQGAVDPGVSLVDIAFISLRAAAEESICGPDLWEKVAAGVPLLLDAAAALSPVDFRLTLPAGLVRPEADLPCFHRATSIQLHAQNLLRLKLPRSSGTFPKLRELSLSFCCVDLAALVLRCPCLHVFRASQAFLDAGINIQSATLQKLIVRTNKDCRLTNNINIEAPMLQQLTLTFGTSTGAELSVTIVAPFLNKVSWGCSYAMNVGHFPWVLNNVRLYSTESLRQRAITTPSTGEDTCLLLSSFYVLSLQMTNSGLFLADHNLLQQIEKHMVTNFSVLELTMVYDHGSLHHVYGPFVLHLLGMHRIRTATQRLRIHFVRPKVIEECPADCLCDEPKNWRSKNISLINLEEVEIKGLIGEDHEFDFLRVIFRCSPMLKRMFVGLSDEATTSTVLCTKIHGVFKEYPLVECNLMQR